MAYSPTTLQYGYLPRSTNALLEIIAGHDREEDVTLSTGDVDLTAGKLCGQAELEDRDNYDCLGIQNIDPDNSVTVKYNVATDDVVREVGLPGGARFTPALRAIVTIIGSTGGSTSGATLKLFYKDKKVVSLARGETSVVTAE